MAKTNKVLDIKDLKIADKITGEEYCKLQLYTERMMRLVAEHKVAAAELDALFLELRHKYNATGLDMEKGGLIIRNEPPPEEISDAG